MFITNGQSTEEIKSILSTAISSLVPMCKRGRVCQAMVRSILLYDCETLPVRVADERVLAVFDNESIRRILHVKHGDCIPTAKLHAASASLAYRRSLSKEGFDGLATLQDVLRVS